ncbi:MAG: cobalamin biosynthesis protein CbiD [Candidatus Methanomethylophilaceae archaeon]|nr:cobalamin biosynthesis protein CbiD [Candidatus Methanomethylophilaceae archaeon]
MVAEQVFVNGRMLRSGYTTGTCATAATKAAAEMLLCGKPVDSVEITVPRGDVLILKIEDIAIGGESVRCAVRKDAGDDIDATDGALIYSSVSRRADGKYAVEGGKGVGRVTRKGLDQPVGNAAINRVPRQMISEVLEDVAEMHLWSGGLEAVIDVPEGENIAVRTFNPNLGIVGGISILGTSGIVEPMSEKALIETIKKEMDMHFAEGKRDILLVPGNYGEKYSQGMEDAGSSSAVKCSNFIGDALDHALYLGVEGVLLVGNIGKLVKVAGGIMNTHSRNADSRMEIMTAHAIAVGADADLGREIMSCVTTESALDVLNSAGIMEDVVGRLAERAEYHMRHRTDGKIDVGTVIFSSNYGRIAQSPGAEALIRRLA